MNNKDQKSSNQGNQGAREEKLRADLQRTLRQLRRMEKLYDDVVEERDELRRQKELLQEQYDCISNSTVWKISKPMRSTLDFLKHGMFRRGPLKLLKKFVFYVRTSGFRGAIHKTRFYLAERKRQRMQSKVDLSRISEERRAAESAVLFDRDVCFSILVPLYNTPIDFLNEMIGSVVGQTYGGWELCLADGSDQAHSQVGEECMRWAQRDPRIKYRKLEKNMGISENTNACIDMATGNYIALFDHDDILHPSALYEMMRAICEQDADYLYTDEATFESPDIRKIITFHYKPDFAADNLRANNYICHFSAFSREVLERTGRFRSEYDGSQDHDMILRLTENAKRIVHIRKLLYFWRSHPMSVAMDINSKTYAIEAGKRAVKESLRRAGYEVEVESSRAFPTIYRLRYQIKSKDLVSIIIPTKNHVKTLKKCINSILERTAYPNYEILIVDNGSTERSVTEYYESIENHPNIRILHYDQPFNYSAINNYAAAEAKGEYLILLNNDIQIITRRWIEEMLMYVQREDVGAAGAMLYYPDNTIQHAGIIMKLGAHRIAGHAFHQWPRNTVGYMGRACYAQNLSAVTAACMMVKASVYRELGGLDESFPVSFNDVDFCLRIRESGRLIVWTPYAEAYHHESKTRGKDDTAENVKRFESDCERFRNRWAKVLEAGDPYYNPNFSLDTASFDVLLPETSNN
ncbi:MAG: glycosyltransferase family 2 protein [Ruminococcaceae bacterium]|nr:glycosyltransferase family 2 protein [Oscillospiraceae bacterium]